MGQLPPDFGGTSVILPGFTVILDETTPLLNHLRIEGSLVFDDSQPNTTLVLKVRRP